MPTPLHTELNELLAAIDAAATIDAEDDALEELAGWADAHLGHGWEPLYAGSALVGVAGQVNGHRVEITRL